MRPERIAARTTVTERRPPTVAAPSRRSAAAPTTSPALAMRQRLGNLGTQALIARSVAPAAPVVTSSSAPAVQCLTAVTSPTDPSEVEAQSVAAKVMRMSVPDAGAAPAAVGHGGPGTVQRAPDGPGAAAPISVRTGGGAPLPPALRDFMEPRFGADFGKVRLHTDASAAAQSAQLNANAFALGQNVYFGAGKYQPDTPAGKELIAHELTHTIQQGAAPQTGAVRRSAAALVTGRSGPRVQREMFGIPNPREYFAGKAAAIPGFTMLTVVIGFNPVTNAPVERNAGNILRGAIDMIPGGFVISEALANHGVFDSVSAWALQQFQTLQNIGAGIWQDIENFLKEFSVLDLRNPGALWERAKGIVTRPLERVKAFAIALKDGIVKLIKDAILKPIAAFARTTSGYPLLCTIMGKDQITGESVPQDPVALLGGFMKFIGEEEIWNNMLKANAIPRAFAWFNGALAALRGFLGQIPGLFVAAFKALDVADILLIPRAFLKLAAVFGNFAGRFISWGAEAAWNLLEIVFDVVSPGALAYIKKTGAALKSILKNPLPFVGNLVKAAKLGFTNFGGNFLGHLKAGLIDWLTGSLPGIYIPKAFSLGEIAKFAFSVLGLSWANIRQKLVKATSEPVVKALETGFDIVVTLVRDGPAAAWEQIKEQLANLKDMVIGGITDFVVDMVVQKAIPKMIAMFIPGAGFISAILSIYDTVMVFVNKISKIIQVVTGFVDSIVNIAAGNIGSAATKVENTLAGLLSLAINFLAGFAGMGKVADKVMAVFAKIRAPVDKALDWLINWIVTMAKKAGKFLLGKAAAAKDALLDWWSMKAPFSDARGKPHKVFFSGKGENARVKVASAEMFTEEFIARIQQLFAQKENQLAKANGSPYLGRCIKAKQEIDKLKVQVEREKKANPSGASISSKKLNDALRNLAGNIRPLIDLLPENQATDLPVKPGERVTLGYGDAERMAEIMFASKERVTYEIKSASGLKKEIATAEFRAQWTAGAIRPYIEKGAREQYLGATPGKDSPTGRRVVAQCATKLDNKGVRWVEWAPGKWWPLNGCDMSHKEPGAVGYWNSVRGKTTPKSPMVRAWMLDWKNYFLEPASANRARGAREEQRYLPP
jgi:hypothetical protein